MATLSILTLGKKTVHFLTPFFFCCPHAIDPSISNPKMHSESDHSLSLPSALILLLFWGPWWLLAALLVPSAHVLFYIEWAEGSWENASQMTCRSAQVRSLDPHDLPDHSSPTPTAASSSSNTGTWLHGSPGMIAPLSLCTGCSLNLEHLPPDISMPPSLPPCSVLPSSHLLYDLC